MIAGAVEEFGSKLREPKGSAGRSVQSEEKSEFSVFGETARNCNGVKGEMPYCLNSSVRADDSTWP